VSASLIIDCSITMSWCFADEATAESQQLARSLQQTTALVPAHWFLEVANVLWTTQRKKRISCADAAVFVARLRSIDIEVDHEAAARAFDHILPLCDRHALTSYDAAYLELALRRQLPLASLDKELCSAAASLGIQVLGGALE